MPRLRAFAIALTLVAGAAPAQDGADETGLPMGQPANRQVTRLEVPSPLVTVDTARLFAQSAWGKRVLSELEEQENALEAETRQTEQELIAEEQELTRLRPEMEPNDFRARATEFDEKVQRLRAETDERSNQLTGQLDAERQKFLIEAVDVLARIVRERGAVAIIDDSAVVLSVGSIDITDDAIARLDAELGDGTPQP